MDEPVVMARPEVLQDEEAGQRFLVSYLVDALPQFNAARQQAYEQALG